MQIVLKQLVIGLWDDDVLTFTQTKNLQQLAAENAAVFDLIVKAGVGEKDTDKAWCTLVGLKLLETNFASTKNTWKLIAKKAR